LTVDGGFAFTDRIPHGVTGHITPWNYPIQLFARTIAPALAVGSGSVSSRNPPRLTQPDRALSSVYA
jgi:acyl-CoA reductase-like NAD-dependent aldehyde dehydrogenase